MNIVLNIKNTLYALSNLFVTNGHLTNVTKVTIACGAAFGAVGIAYVVARKCLNGKATTTKADPSINKNSDNSRNHRSLKTNFVCTTLSLQKTEEILKDLEREEKKNQKDRTLVPLHQLSDQEKELYLGIKPTMSKRLQEISRKLDEAFETRDTWKPTEIETK
ncbi:MAG: hypothetical protein JSR80_07415 [Verrucomicrobia bacterium]|nr:hypothetical protein [Verrucomicrobiota bacterium]